MRRKTAKTLTKQTETSGESPKALICSSFLEIAPTIQGFAKTLKPQIISVPGISTKQRDRYRVVLGDQVLGDQLNIDQAIALAKGGVK